MVGESSYGDSARATGVARRAELIGVELLEGCGTGASLCSKPFRSCSSPHNSTFFNSAPMANVGGKSRLNYNKWDSLEVGCLPLRTCAVPR